MSTKFTRKSPLVGYDLADSHALALAQTTELFRDKMVKWLLLKLAEDGFDELKANQLTFLGSLDCGANYASELARALGITRQAIHKTVRDLEKAGWLATKPNDQLGNQRAITFTAEGECMMSCARSHFLELDAILIEQFGKANLATLDRLLAFDPATPR